MTEIEKGLIKEKYSRIGKVEEDGVIIEDTPVTIEERKQQESTEWLEKKSSLIYDYEEDSVNFARSKPTEWTGNKRIHLPKSGSSSLEAYLEVRRKSASRIYDQCLALLGEGDDRKGYENLSSEEKIGL